MSAGHLLLTVCREPRPLHAVQKYREFPVAPVFPVVECLPVETETPVEPVPLALVGQPYHLSGYAMLASSPSIALVRNCRSTTNDVFNSPFRAFLGSLDGGIGSDVHCLKRLYSLTILRWFGYWLSKPGLFLRGRGRATARTRPTLSISFSSCRLSTTCFATCRGAEEEEPKPRHWARRRSCRMAFA